MCLVRNYQNPFPLCQTPNKSLSYSVGEKYQLMKTFPGYPTGLRIIHSLTLFIYSRQQLELLCSPLAIHMQRKFINIDLFIWLEVISSFQIFGLLLLKANATKSFGAHPEQYIAVQLNMHALASHIQAAAQKTPNALTSNNSCLVHSRMKEQDKMQGFTFIKFLKLMCYFMQFLKLEQKRRRKCDFPISFQGKKKEKREKHSIVEIIWED